MARLESSRNEGLMSQVVLGGDPREQHARLVKADVVWIGGPGGRILAPKFVVVRTVAGRVFSVAGFSPASVIHTHDEAEGVVARHSRAFGYPADAYQVLSFAKAPPELVRYPANSVAETADEE